MVTLPPKRQYCSLNSPALRNPPVPPFGKGGDGGICVTAGADVRRYVNSVAPSLKICH